MQKPSRSHQESQFVYRLAACLAASHEAFEGFCASLDQNYVSYESRAVPAEELPSWLNFVEEKVFPLNMATAKLIDEHRYFWEELPPGLADFMEYHTSWLARHTAWKAEPMQPYTFRADRSFPLRANTWTLQQLRDLMRSVAGSQQRQVAAVRAEPSSIAVARSGGSSPVGSQSGDSVCFPIGSRPHA
jgi:hypothetical protein